MQEIELNWSWIVLPPQWWCLRTMKSMVIWTDRMNLVISWWSLKMLNWVLALIGMLSLFPCCSMSLRISLRISIPLAEVILTLSVWPSSLWSRTLVALSTSVVIIPSSLLLLIVNWHQWSWDIGFLFRLSSRFFTFFQGLYHSLSRLFGFFSLLYSFCHSSSFHRFLLDRLDYLGLFQIFPYKWLNWRVIRFALAQNLDECWIRSAWRWGFDDWRQFMRCYWSCGWL